MTNREKYGEQVLDILCSGTRVAVVKGKPKMCKGMACHECDFPINYPCSIKLGEWLNAEYVEPQVDWSKVAVDTKILVSNYPNDCYCPRHYAGRLDNKGRVLTWVNGRSSWTKLGEDDVCCWEYAKLAEDEE